MRGWQLLGIINILSTVAVAGQENMLAERILAGTLSHGWLRQQKLTTQQLDSCMACGTTPLMFAIEHQMLHAVRILLEAGAGPNVSVGAYTPLELAAACSTVRIMQELMRHGARLTPKLCLHAPKRHDVFYFLTNVIHTIKKHPSRRPNHRVYGLTRDVVEMCLDHLLLHVQDEKELVALLDIGANIAFKDAQGKTALDYAVVGCHWKIAKILLSKGAHAALPGSVALAQQALAQADTLDRRNACTVTTQLPVPAKPFDTKFPG